MLVRPTGLLGTPAITEGVTDERRRPRSPSDPSRDRVDQWVARADERDERPRRPGASRSSASERLPPAGRLASCACDRRSRRSLPFVIELGLPLPLRRHHAPLRAARARAERRRRLGRPARPRATSRSSASAPTRMRSSRRRPATDIHLPDAASSIPIVVVVGGAARPPCSGSPSRRLLGDYLAIVTLFFGQIFVVFTINVDRHSRPTDHRHGGPNGHRRHRPVHLLRLSTLDSDRASYFFVPARCVVASCSSSLLLPRASRAPAAPGGRSREDPLAAELMSMPVNRLKLHGVRVRRRDRRPRPAASSRPSRPAPSRRTSSVPLLIIDLRGRDPRRHRQPHGRRPRRDRRSSSRSSCSRDARPARASSSTWRSLRRADRRAPSVAAARARARRDRRLRLRRARDRRRRSGPTRTAGEVDGGRLARPA